MRMARFVAGSLALLFSAGALAYPVTYSFTGTVTQKNAVDGIYNDDPNVAGTITFDIETATRQTMTRYADMDISYRVSMAGQTFEARSHNPYNFTFANDGNVEFYDEVPESSVRGGTEVPGFDWGIIDFRFSGSPFANGLIADLPIDLFIGGSVSFGGAISAEGGSIAASINSLVRVPEPASATLLSIGLLGLLVTRRKRKN